MSSEHRDPDLDEQLQLFAITLEAESGEPIRPVPQRLSTDIGLDRSVDIGTPGTVILGPSRRERRHWLLPVAAATATVVVVIGGLAVLSDDAPLVDDPAPAESVVPRPNTSIASEPTVAPGSTLAPAPTTGAPDTAAPTTVPAPAISWDRGLLADIELEGLLPLAAASDGDFVVPTTPSDWRILSGGFGTHPAGFSNSSVTIIEARPDGTTGPGIEVRVSILGICVELGDFDCATSGESTAINGVEWQPFTELNGARATVGDLFIDVQVDDPELQGSVLDDPLIVKYLEGLRVGTGDDYWETLQTEVGQACWTCSDEADLDETTLPSVDESDSEPSATPPNDPSNQSGVET